MCLITEQKKAIRTKEDMIVWKIVCVQGNHRVISPYHDFEWEEGRLYKTRLAVSKKPIAYDRVVQGEYNILPFQVGEKYLKDYLPDLGLKAIGEGFHAFTDEYRADCYRTIRQFLIPAGSLIYKDKTGLIVSNQIMMLPNK